MFSDGMDVLTCPECNLLLNRTEHGLECPSCHSGIRPLVESELPKIDIPRIDHS